MWWLPPSARPSRPLGSPGRGQCRELSLPDLPDVVSRAVRVRRDVRVTSNACVGSRRAIGERLPEPLVGVPYRNVRSLARNRHEHRLIGAVFKSAFSEPNLVLACELYHLATDVIGVVNVTAGEFLGEVETEALVCSAFLIVSSSAPASKQHSGADELRNRETCGRRTGAPPRERLIRGCVI